MHLYPPLFDAPARGIPSAFLDETYTVKTRVMGLLYGENCMILTSTVFDWSTRVMDGQTDGQTDGRTGDSIARSACCRALKKTVGGRKYNATKFVWLPGNLLERWMDTVLFCKLSSLTGRVWESHEIRYRLQTRDNVGTVVLSYSRTVEHCSGQHTHKNLRRKQRV